jgi:hypothetical protein
MGVKMKFGPTFGSELVAAGIAPVLSWDPATGEVLGTDKLSTTDRAKLAMVMQAHDPTRQRVPPVLTKVQLIRALRQSGLDVAFKAALAAAGPDVHDDYEAMANVPRADGLVTVVLGQIMGLNARAIDNLWRTGEHL